MELKILKKIRLGDKIAKATSAIGIKPCNGCKERQKLLNGESPSKNNFGASLAIVKPTRKE